MIPFETRLLKQIQAAALLARLEGGRIDRLRLLKLLYMADRESIAERGVPIVGGRVAALDNGPLHSEIYDLIKGAHEAAATWGHYFANDGHMVVLSQDPDRMELSPYDVETLTVVSESRRGMDTWAVADETQGYREWKESHVPGSSRTIPVERIMKAVGLSESDIREILDEAESHAKTRRLLLQRKAPGAPAAVGS